MNVLKNARLTPLGRTKLVRREMAGQGRQARTVSKWIARFRSEGPDGLVDRSPR